MAGDPDKLSRRHVEQNGSCAREIFNGLNRSGREHLAPKGAEVRGKGLGHPLRAAPGNRPANGVASHRQDEAKRRGNRPLQGHHRVPPHPSEEGPGPLASERPSRKAVGRPKRAQPKSGQGHRVARRAQRAEQFSHQPVPISHQRRHQPSICRGVPVQAVGCRVNRALEYRRRSVVQRVCKRRRGMHPLQAMLSQRQCLEERGADAERVER